MGLLPVDFRKESETGLLACGLQAMGLFCQVDFPFFDASAFVCVCDFECRDPGGGGLCLPKVQPPQLPSPFVPLALARSQRKTTTPIYFRHH